MPEESEAEERLSSPVDLNPWDRGGLGGEKDSDESFAAFATYLEMGLQRSLAKCAAACGKHVSLMERWARRDNWTLRVRAWDRHNARVINERVLLGTAAMRERTAGIGLNLQVKAAQRLMKMTDAELDMLNVRDLVAMIRAGTAVEASSRDISADELEGAVRDTAPTFNIGFVTARPDGMVSVRLVTGECGYIPKENIEAFKADYPDAMVIA